MQSIQPKILDVVEAFQIIGNPVSNSEQVSLANSFLFDCEKSSKFASILIKIYSNTTIPQVQLQSLILLLNIIKRNWQIRRSRSVNQECESIEKEKPAIRTNLICAYSLYDFVYYKHFNQIFKCLARQDYPTKYEELHSFILNSLNSLLTLLSTNTFTEHINTIKSVLSTIKVIIKQYSLKRLAHNEQIFIKYISDVIKISINISNEIQKGIDGLIQSNSYNNILEFFLQSATKIDKIILYSLQSMTNMMQFRSEICEIIQNILMNLYKLNAFFESQLNLQSKIRERLQLYIAGVLQRVSKLQGLYPFLFTQFLENYLTLILNMLLQNIPKPNLITNQRLITTIIQANLKPFTTFTYYMTSTEFSGSVYNRKGNNNSQQMQIKCHEQFRKIFTNQTITQFLSTILTQVMTSKSVLEKHTDVIDHEMVLEQNQGASQDILSQISPYQHCVLLAKNVVRCFKNQLKDHINNLFISVGEIGTQNNAKTQRIICNTMQVILVLPKIYDQNDLPLQHVMKLLEVLYSHSHFGLLARLIKNYHEHLNQKTIQDCFRILTQVVATPLTSPNLSIDIIYQCALTMKKMLTEHDSQSLPLQNLSGCLQNFMSLLGNKKFTQTPTLLWPLINLSNQILKLLPAQIVIKQIGSNILSTIWPFLEISNQEELTVCGISEMLQNLMNITCCVFKTTYCNNQSNQKFIDNQCAIRALSAAFMLFSSNIQNKNMQNIDNLYRLWLCLVKNYPTLQQQSQYNIGAQLSYLNNKLQQTFSAFYMAVLKEDTLTLLQILEEYIIIGLLKLSEAQILSIFQTVLKGCSEEHKTRSLMALFSVYYTYLCTTNTLIPNLIILLMQQIQVMYTKLSPQQNGLRALLLMIFDICIIKFGARQIYQILNNNYGNDYSKWFYYYCWSHQYVSIKFSYKINGIALLKTIDDLGIETFAKMLSTPIEGQFPFDIALKVIGKTLQPLKKGSIIASYHNMHKIVYPTQFSSVASLSVPRKIRLQLSGIVDQIIANDYRDMFAQKISQLFKLWNWGQDNIFERFTKTDANEIIELLRGTYKQEYQLEQNQL